MADGVIMINADGIILMVNRAAAALFAFSEETAVGSRFMETIPDYEINDVLQSCLKSSREGSSHRRHACIGDQVTE